ncbi:MAG: hypothetical protein ACOCXA_02070 [Planctomycetota bacterium]
MSSLTLDYTNCLASSIGATHGLTDPELDTLVAKIPKHHDNIVQWRDAKECAWFDLPGQDLGAIKQIIDQHDHGRWQDVVLVGIGGAVSTPRCILETLSPVHGATTVGTHARPRIVSIENIDPLEVSETLAAIDAKKTLFVIVSRNGHSAEVNALLLYLSAWLKRKSGRHAIAEQMLVCTNPDGSPLGHWAAREKATVVPVQDNLCDSYSVYGNPTLLTLALGGIAIDKFLAGAQAMQERCWQGDARTNPAYMHAAIHYLLTRKRRKTIHATVGFSRRLQGVIAWYDHLLAVSLGKMLNRKGKAVHVGPAPASCIGPGSLHGHLQLYAEGPFDKVTTFLTVQHHGERISIPKSSSKDDAIAFCGGHDLADLVHHCYLCAAGDITGSGRPNMTIQLADVSPESIGGLCYILQLSTVMSAELYGIDPFNQPGIELNQQALYGLMGRKGFEDKAAALHRFSAGDKKTC